MVADREPEDDRRGDQPAIRARVAGRPRPVVAADPVVPADEQAEQDRDQRQVEDMRVGVRADRPGQGRQGEREARGDPDGDRARQRPDQVDRHRGGDPEAHRRQQVHPERLVAERLEQRPGEPAQQDVGRESGRMRGAEDGSHRLELPGVPERDAGQQREAREGERHDADHEGRRQVRGVRSATLCYAQIHLPRSCRSRSR